ncbi:MAG: potassium/proton antiporter [Clostridiales bacterium]|nr:potassium/proton antiporter [Clostridiales bacterium]
MSIFLLIASFVLLICITSSKILYRFGIPTLLIFLVIGMLFGSDGIARIYFDNMELAKEISSIGLVIILFYGGFNTNIKAAKPAVILAILLSTVGVVITAGVTGLFCHYILKIGFLESFLVGAVVSSTDAASVFSILRSQKLNLKGSLASILEIESGSNDPFAYMITILVLSLMGSGSDHSMVHLLFTQLFFGITVPIALSFIAIKLMRKIEFEIEGFYPIFFAAIALLSFSGAELLGGNGYLSVYLFGIIVGNSKIPHKKSTAKFFDGICWLIHIAMFFLLGLLSFPSKFVDVMAPGLLVALFLLVVARPVAVFLLLSFFKMDLKEKLFISWGGLRGAASIVFAMIAVTSGINLQHDIFHTIFFICLVSVALQGTLLPYVAKKLNLVDDNMPVLKTFNDYASEKNNQLLEVTVDEDSKWCNKTIMDANIPEEILIVMIKRNDEVIVPKGNTKIQIGDILVLSGNHIETLIAV